MRSGLRSNLHTAGSAMILPKKADMAEVPEPLALSAIARPSRGPAFSWWTTTRRTCCRCEPILEDLGQNLVEAHSGEEALRAGQGPRVRRRPARRPDAGDQRLRDGTGRSGPTSAPGTRPSSFSPPATSTARRSEEGYRARRSGFLGEAAAAGRPPIEGPGIRRTVPGQAAGEARGRPASAARPRDDGLRHLHARPAGPGRHLERRGRADEGLQGRRDHRPALLPLLPAGGASTVAGPPTNSRSPTAEGRFEDEGWRLRKDGSRFWANVVITALRGRAGATCSASPKSPVT